MEVCIGVIECSYLCVDLSRCSVFMFMSVLFLIYGNSILSKIAFT